MSVNQTINQIGDMQGLSLSARVESVSRPESVSRSDDLEGKKVDLPDMNSKRDKEREEEEERVFIVSTKGRYGPEKKPYTPEYVTYTLFFYKNHIFQAQVERS